jgi:hypothetical protein
MLKNTIFNLATSDPPKSSADVRAAYRARLEAEVPSDLARAGTRLVAARDHKSELCSKLERIQKSLDKSGDKREPTPAERELMEEIAHADAAITECRRVLRSARELFSDQLRGLVIANLRKEVPKLVKVAAQLCELGVLLEESDNFARAHGVDPVGYATILSQIATLGLFAEQLARS